MEICDMLNSVKTRDDFIRFISKMEEDKKENGEEWEKYMSNRLDKYLVLDLVEGEAQ